MTRSRNFTPYILTAFFATILLLLIGAQAWSHEQAAEAAQSDAADIYIPADEDLPVTDAVIETTAS